MTVGGVSAGSDLYSGGVQDRFKQRKENFDALAKALSSGDLAGAQKAFAAVQQGMPQAGKAQQGQTAQGATPSNALSTDIDALSKSLSSGDLAGAQKALATLQQDMQKVGHHRHHAKGGQSSLFDTASAGATTQASTDFGSLLTSLGSGDLSGAKTAFDSLLQDLQQVQNGKPTTQAAGTGPSADFAALSKSLSSGDLTGAQKAFASLQQDMQQMRQRQQPYAPTGIQQAAAFTSGAMVNEIA